MQESIENLLKNKRPGIHLGSLTIGLGLGALAAWILDPQQGQRRRTMIRDQAVKAQNSTLEFGKKTSRDMVNKTKGFFSETFRKSPMLSTIEGNREGGRARKLDEEKNRSTGTSVRNM